MSYHAKFSFLCENACAVYLEMAAQVNIINECRAICISGRLNNSNANLWIKCQTLGENWVSV